MLILGIETSCDETAAAVVANGTKVISSTVSSSEDLQKKWGGIIPEQAAREQLKFIMPVIQETLGSMKIETCDIAHSSNSQVSKYSHIVDAIAVTVGPGLIGSLLIGVETAKTLSWVWKKPLIPINHLIAHIYANFINQPAACLPATIFPALCLIVSGGHTELVLMKNHGEFKMTGSSLDDAAGECFDKTARLLGLGYPGGPAIEAAASKLKMNNQKLKIIKHRWRLPRSLLRENNFNFSFSGLKTAVLYLIKKMNKQQFTNYQKLIAYEIQEAITDVLVIKTIKAALKFKVKSILIGGGVAANFRLREKLRSAVFKLISQSADINLFMPEKKWCADNAAAIASAAFFNYKPKHWSQIKINPALDISSE